MWAAFKAKSLDEDTIRIILKSCTAATVKQYESAFTKWINFCHVNTVNPLSSNVPVVLRFLTSLYKNGLGYSSLNNVRSALSLILCHVDGVQVGCHPLVVRFMRAIGKLRPPALRYNMIWDVNLVLNKLIDWGETCNLTLKLLSIKLLGLLAITTGQRVQTLGLLRLENIICTGNLINIKVPDQVKTSKPGSFQPNLILAPYDVNSLLCPVRTINEYLKRTCSLRKSSHLFISYEFPHKFVDKQTLSRWLKYLLNESGIDTKLFKSHSVRHASTSKAFQKGVNIDVLMDSAGWTRDSKVFGKFYKRNIMDRCEFGATTLDM